jgi:hypothetical protein
LLCIDDLHTFNVTVQIAALRQSTYPQHAECKRADRQGADFGRNVISPTLIMSAATTEGRHFDLSDIGVNILEAAVTIAILCFG